MSRSPFDRRSTMNNFIEPWTTFTMLNKIFKTRALKNKFPPFSVFLIDTFLSTSNNQGFFAFMSITSCALFYVNWLANFWRWENLTGLLEFHITYSKVLLTACANQLLYNLSLIELCSAYAIKNTRDACLLLVK